MLLPNGKFRCSKCGQERTYIEMGHNRHAHDGCGAWCLACQRAINVIARRDIKLPHDCFVRLHPGPAAYRRNWLLEALYGAGFNMATSKELVGYFLLLDDIARVGRFERQRGISCQGISLRSRVA